MSSVETKIKQFELFLLRISNFETLIKSSNQKLVRKIENLNEFLIFRNIFSNENKINATILFL